MRDRRYTLAGELTIIESALDEFNLGSRIILYVHSPKDLELLKIPDNVKSLWLKDEIGAKHKYAAKFLKDDVYSFTDPNTAKVSIFCPIRERKITDYYQGFLLLRPFEKSWWYQLNSNIYPRGGSWPDHLGPHLDVALETPLRKVSYKPAIYFEFSGDIYQTLMMELLLSSTPHSS